jgi:RHS repeat-associated protein
LALAVLCAGTGIAGFSVAVLGGGAGGSGAPALGSAGIDRALVVHGVDALEGGQQAEAQLLAQRVNPQAIAERKSSRTVYEGASATAAAQLAGKAFPQVVDRPSGQLDLPPGEHVARYLGDHTALLDVGRGRHAIVESLAPIATKTQSGGHAGLDLSLTATTSGFAPRDAATPVSIPKRLSEGVALLHDRAALTPLGGSGSPSSVAGNIDGQAVMYPDVLTDSDVLVKPTPSGFESFTVLRSVRSPQQLSFKLSVPAGAQLVASADRSAPVQVLSSGRSIATVLTPTARDASGMPVPVSAKLVGDELRVSVNHRAGGYQYPIAVDPTVEDKAMLLKTESAAGNWAFGRSSSSAPFSSNCGNCLNVDANGSYLPGEYGYLEYRTQHQSRIYGVTASVTEEQYYVEATLAMSLSLRHGAEIEKNEAFPPKPGPTYYEAVKVCIETGCTAAPVNASHEENSVVFKLEAQKSGSFGSGMISSVAVQINQEKAPTVSVDTTDSKFGTAPNGAYPGHWASGNNAKVGLIANDPGIGISADSFSSPQEVSWGHAFSAVPGCEGAQCNECWNYEAKCEAGHSSGKEPLTYSLKGLPDGKDTIEAKVEDATTLAASTSVTVSMDSSAPHNITLTGLPSSHEVGESNYHLKATASDGASIESSGIESIAFQMDGKEIGSASGSCAPGPCTATSKEVTINGEEFGAGQHTLSVLATDKAGNVATENITVTVHHASPIGTGPGAVEPVTGEMSLGSTDVSVNAGPTSLTLSRSYLSRHLTTGASGPLGPQWSLGVGGEESLVKQPNGSMLLVGASGGQTTFTSAGSGKYNSPSGDAGLVLSESTWTGKTLFLLSNNGATTTFAIPSGGSGSVWMPSISEGAGGTNLTTFAFKTAGGITEPEEVLAPVPSGVSCSPTLNKGCRALTFTYATTTTATGEAPSGWGEYNGRLVKVSLTAWDPASSKMTTTAVAQYAYDTQGRLRAEWDPRISPALKTTYGYDSEGHVTAVSPPGQEPWLLAYGSNSGDVSTGRLVSASRPAAATALGESAAPANTGAPTLSTSSASIGKYVNVSNGTWSNSPLAYSYQWERCASGGSKCTLIYGARNQSYLPTLSDAGYALVAQVTAVNADGSTTAATTASEVVAGVTPTSTLQFGSEGSGNGQFKQPTSAAYDTSGNMWVTDEANNRVEEFNPAGEYVKAFSPTEGNQLKGAWGIAIEQSTGNVFVSDVGDCRVEELSSTGAVLRTFGSCGSGSGQLNSPSGLALDPEGNVWVADYGNNRLEEFSNTGSYMRTVGSAGTGNGQLKSPRSLVFAGSNVYVSDTGNNRVEEFSEVDGSYVAQFGSSGTGNGQFSSPIGIASDTLSGDVYVVDDNNNRVQQFTSTGTYVTKFGTVGTGAGQLKNPLGIAVSPTGAIIVMDAGNNRVSQWWPTPSPIYGMAIGSFGSGNGQLNKPIDEAVDPMGNVWVTDSSNNRIEKFSPYGAFLGAYGSFGTGHGQFNSPGGIAINQTTGNIYVTDQKNGRFEEFSPTGKYITEFGKGGKEPGEFSDPYGIAVDASGNIWVADLFNNRVQEFSQSETSFSLVQVVGKKGTGNGEFIEPMFLAFDGGNLYVTDKGNSRVEEFEASNGKYVAQFGSKGAGNGQFEFVEGIAADPMTGTLYVADTGKNRVEEFSTTGAFLTTFGSLGTGEGQFKSPVGLAFNSAGTLYTDDYGNNRIVKGTAGNVQTEAPAPPSVGTTAVTTIAYKVPVTGAGAPYMMGSSEVAAWGQEDDPTDATAVFAPDEMQTTPASDYRRATIDYLDGSDRLVNTVTPGGGISTSEYNSYNDVVRTLSPVNRETALKEGSKSAEVSRTLDTQSTYESEGTELTSTLGPIHTVKLSSGSEVQARTHVKYYYDEGAPSEGGPYRLVTKMTEGAQIAEKPEEDIRTTVTSYSGQENLGWLLRRPTSVTADPSGLKLIHTTQYERSTGEVKETRTPGAGAATEEAPMTYTYTTSYGSAGSENGKLAKPGAIARDKSGNFWVADTENNRVEEFSSSGVYAIKWGTLGTGRGQFKKPEGIAIDAEGHIWVADTGNNRLQEFNSSGTLLNVIESVEFKTISEPVGIGFVKSGEEVGMMYILEKGSSRVVQAVVASESAGEWRSFGGVGTGNGKLKSPEGLLVDAEGNVWIADTGNNRVQEFTATGSYMRQFGTLGNGNGQLSKPEGLSFDSEGNVLVADGGNNRVEIFSPRGNYLYAFGTVGIGSGQMKTPAGLVLDGSNNAYVLDTGNSRIEKWTWAEHVSNGGTHGTQTIYYTSGANSKYASCGEHAEWIGLPCQTQPAAQPNTSGVPNLPVTTFKYNIWNEPLTSVDTVGSTTRTTTTTYDGAGRVSTKETTSTVGTALPKVTYEYDSATGIQTKQSTTVEGKTRTLTSVYNKLGELTSYTDGDENTSSYTYDLDGRTETFNDGKGTQTYTYDATTGYLTRLVDSAAGTFTGTYDAEGGLTIAGYPNGMNANYIYSATGEADSVEYIKTTHCTTGCTWFSEVVKPSIHGQTVTSNSGLGTDSYTYDAVGRLAQTQDTPESKGCTTRIYMYDVDTNRQALTTREPGVGGVCGTEGGTSENHSYDSADRLTDTGVVYDTFGDITKVSAADAGGSELTSTYYVDNQVASLTQNGQTIGYNLDPAGRIRENVLTGKVVATFTSHFAGPDASTPSWSSEASTKWERDITGIDGALVAVQHNGETPVLQLADLRGNIVATAFLSETATELASRSGTTEFGVPRTSIPPRYSWLGANEIPTELPSGIVTMGLRSYVPELGRFLQTDPMPGGSTNAYAYTHGDPVDESDLTGQYDITLSTSIADALAQEGAATAARVAAEEAAARAAAEAAAQAALLRSMAYADFGAGEEYEEEEAEEEEEEAEYVSFHNWNENGKNGSLNGELSDALLVQKTDSGEISTEKGEYHLQDIKAHCSPKWKGCGQAPGPKHSKKKRKKKKKGKGGCDPSGPTGPEVSVSGARVRPLCEAPDPEPPGVTPTPDVPGPTPDPGWDPGPVPIPAFG